MSLPDRIFVAATRAIAVALGLMASAAHADESVREAAADPQATPSHAAPDFLTQSATVFQQDDLENRRITTLADIAAGVPELSSTPALDSLSTLSLYMRGE